jgi:hypothetical protein
MKKEARMRHFFLESIKTAGFSIVFLKETKDEIRARNKKYLTDEEYEKVKSKCDNW